MRENTTQVLWALQQYKDGIMRAELRSILHLDDRAIRKAIEDLRRIGEPIGQAPVSGYTYGNDTDVRRAINDYRAKAKSNFDIAEAMEHGTIEGQVGIDVV